MCFAAGRQFISSSTNWMTQVTPKRSGTFNQERNIIIIGRCGAQRCHLPNSIYGRCYLKSWRPSWLLLRIQIPSGVVGGVRGTHHSQQNNQLKQQSLVEHAHDIWVAFLAHFRSCYFSSVMCLALAFPAALMASVQTPTNASLSCSLPRAMPLTLCSFSSIPPNGAQCFFGAPAQMLSSVSEV